MISFLRRSRSSLRRSSLILLALCATSAPFALFGNGAYGQSNVIFPSPTWTDTVGPIALSSPTVTSINGTQVVIFCSENGYLYVVNATTGAVLPGWPQPVDIFAGSGPTAIESSPTLAYVNGPSKPPLIIVGAGSTYVANQQGGLMAFTVTGAVKFRFHTMDIFDEWDGSGQPGGYDNGVISTPVVGDITGSGKLDIVFGAWDHRLYALTATGKMVPGFPIDTQDTIWSSAVLFHIRGPHHQVDIFIGGDASGRDNCRGGFIYDVTYSDGAPKIQWQRCENQTIWSSPAVGVINHSNRPAVVVGTGFGETPPYRSGSYRLFGLYAKNGRVLPGWPVTTTGPTFGSPAIGLLPGSSTPAVVDDSWCAACTSTPSGISTVRAWSGSGTLLWSQQINGGEDFSSPILADLTGSGVNDVLIGSSAGLYALNGANGEFLFGTTNSQPVVNCSIQNSPAIANIAGSGPGTGWHLFLICGGPQEITPSGRLISYPLPAAPAMAPPWPMWRQNSSHTGVAP